MTLVRHFQQLPIKFLEHSQKLPELCHLVVHLEAIVN